MCQSHLSGSCFNPRLPLPGGDAIGPNLDAVIRQVSIHASRCREAMPKFVGIKSRYSLFQSTPPVAGRRCFAIG